MFNNGQKQDEKSADKEYDDLLENRTLLESQKQIELNQDKIDSVNNLFS